MAEPAERAEAAIRLRDREWLPRYSHEDGDLVELFFVPALQRTVLYQRVTGYFSADALSLAARGLDALLHRGGRMQLIVGCTLQPSEVEQIERGYVLRDLIQRDWAARQSLAVDDTLARERLGWLAWLVANGHLDIKLAVPKDAHGRFCAGLGLYHAKSGLLTDAVGDQLDFTGSINETDAGWRHNVEAFSVSCSWRGEWDRQRVARTAEEFARLWANRARSAEVLDFPEALRHQLLHYLPASDAFVTPPLGTPPPVPVPEVNERVPPGPTIDERRRLLWAFLRSAPSRAGGPMFTVRTSAIEPWPHQLRAYQRMLDQWPCRLLIADEVGLGKTIEAGLLLRHVWIAGLARRVLILVPKALLSQWQAELYEKFNLLVPIYTGRRLVETPHHGTDGVPEREIGRDEWTMQPIVLASSHLVRRAERQAELLDAEAWDLVILDEAHHARRKGAGQPKAKGVNRLLGLMQQLAPKTKALLLLTATPMQVHPVEVFDLLSLLGMPQPWSEPAFLDYFEVLGANPDEKKMRELAKLFQATEAACGALSDREVARVAARSDLSPLEGKAVIDALRERRSAIPLKRLTAAQRRAAFALLKLGSPVRARMSRHTRGLLREYHRRGLLDANVAQRVVDDRAIELSPDERSIYARVEDYISTKYEAAAKDKKTAVGFVMTVYRRRLASSFAALRRTFERRLAQLDHREAVDDSSWEEDVPQDEGADEVLGSDEAAALANAALVAEERDEIKAMLKDIARLGTDTKARVLVEEIERAFRGGYKQVIVFTQYTDTLDYLKDFLADRLDVSVGCYSGRGGQARTSGGGWTACTREQIKKKVRTGEIALLLGSDAAGEGLNLQTCGVLVNYDLPWNPMKVEQRIGRIDRIGQQHAQVRIVNLAYRDTVEADIYFALSQRIQLFQGVVGKLQPILSRLPKQFEAAVLASDHDRARHDAVVDVDKLVADAQASGFDLDEVSEADLERPEFEESAVRPEHIDEVLARKDLLPLGVEVTPLEARTYALRVPGRLGAVRVTGDPKVFDDHFESHQLLWQDSPVFRRLIELSGAEETHADELAGHTMEELLTPPR